MSDTNATISNDPSLKRYFKYMLTNRRMSVQFTSRKIREIIETDLGIKLQPPQSLYARVCIEAFAYYMQSWPEWNLAIKSQYSDILYDCLITYLRNKLLYLKQREANFKQGVSPENNTVTLPLPGNMHISMVKGMKKVRAPYSLKVYVPEHMMTTTDIGLRNFGTNHVYLDLGKPTPSTDKTDIEFKDLLNYPCVYAELNIPGLINFSRSCSVIVDRYLGTQSDDPIPIDSNHIISVENTDPNSPHKVYSYQFMALLFNSLNKCFTKFTNEADEALKSQISTLCDAFLKDIFESNVKNTTVCEGSTVKYNIGKYTYYVDHELSTQNILNETLVFKKMIIPVSSYNLISCDLNADNIADDGTLKFFSFSDNNDTMQEKIFFHRIKNCLRLKCLKCDAMYTLPKLQEHMKENHTLQNKFRCIKCKKCMKPSKLFTKRWQHDCNIDVL